MSQTPEGAADDRVLAAAVLRAGQDEQRRASEERLEREQKRRDGRHRIGARVADRRAALREDLASKTAACDRLRPIAEQASARKAAALAAMPKRSAGAFGNAAFEVCVRRLLSGVPLEQAVPRLHDVEQLKIDEDVAVTTYQRAAAARAAALQALQEFESVVGKARLADGTGFGAGFLTSGSPERARGELKRLAPPLGPGARIP